MSNTEPREIIKFFLIDSLKVNELNDADNIFTKGLVNSLFAMQLVMFVESSFNIQVENEELDLTNFCSVDAMSSFVEKKLKASNGV